MFCPECGSEITEEMKFCANCGFKVTDDMRKTKTEANKSQNDIPLATNVEEVEDDEVADEIKTDEKVVETNTVATEKPSITDKAKAKISQMWSSLSMFGKVMTIGIGVSALLFLIALNFGTIFAVIFSVLQIALLVFACLMKKGVIKTPNKMLQIVLPIIALVLIVPYMLLFSVGSDYKDAERINWSELIMGEVIPEPASNLGEIYLNSDDYLSVEIVKLSAEQYKEYLTVCKDKGFTVDSDQSDTLYDAYNKDGYKLHLYYYEGENELDISLNAPIKMSQMTWSTSDYGKMLPTPKSTLGRIEKDDKTGLTVYIGETTLDDYNAYVTACTEKGFTVNSKKTEKTFTASNAEGYKLTVDYKGNNTMYISLKEPEFETEIKVVCRENLMFSTYDVEFYIDDNSVGSIEHGKTETFTETLKKGTHTIKFENTDDDGVIGEVEVEITKLEKLEFKIWCYSDKIDIDVVSGSVKEETTGKDKEETSKPEETTSTPEETESEPEKVEPENLTVDNCPELAAMLSNKAEIDASYSTFATKYKGRIIEFDGRIDYCTKHGNYNTRFDYLVSAGNYNPDSQIGPSFKFEDVNYYDLNTDLDTVSVGLNVRIVAEVVSFDSNSGLFYLDPISVTSR